MMVIKIATITMNASTAAPMIIYRVVEPPALDRSAERDKLKPASR
jgi:hypothetical protein